MKPNPKITQRNLKFLSMQSNDLTPLSNGQSLQFSKRFYIFAGITFLFSLSGIVWTFTENIDFLSKWQSVINILIDLIGLLISWISLRLIKHRRIESAGWILIYFAMLNGLLTSFIFSGIGLFPPNPVKFLKSFIDFS